MPRRRIRTFTLWTGTLLSLLIAVAFVASAWWAFILQLDPVAVYVYGGSVVILLDDPFVSTVSVDQHVHGLSRWATFTSGNTRMTWVEFPIGVVLLAVAVPTLLVWRFWPKPVKPGHCRCGYDLTSNVSGTCPECGRRATRA